MRIIHRSLQFLKLEAKMTLKAKTIEVGLWLEPFGKTPEFTAKT
jgi:hypothetical protein